VTTVRAAERVAREIELDIIQTGLVAGDSLGSESDLMERYQVSRGSIREAITLVEHHLQAETRRGYGGGLIVAEPRVDVITEIASLYLARKRTPVSDLFEIRILLEGKSIELAAASLDDAKIEALRAETSRPDTPAEDLGGECEKFHLLIAEMSGNGVVQMVLPMLSGLVNEVWTAHNRKPTAKQRKEIWLGVQERHGRIAEAIIAGDTDLAKQSLADHLRHTCDVIAAHQSWISPREMVLSGTRQ
jgi:DNA-binding FadR family transcriptional regulator